MTKSVAQLTSRSDMAKLVCRTDPFLFEPGTGEACSGIHISGMSGDTNNTAVWKLLDTNATLTWRAHAGVLRIGGATSLVTAQHYGCNGFVGCWLLRIRSIKRV